MPPINLCFRLPLLIFVLLNISSNIRADDCAGFVKQSIQQQDRNLFNLCGYRGSQWTSSAKHLFRECGVMSLRDRNKRLAMRDKLLMSCSVVVDLSAEFASFGRNRQQKLMSLLIKAIQLQNENLVRSILNARVNLGEQPLGMDASPLYVAVKTGNYHLARILIRAGAKPYLLATGEINPISLLLGSGSTNYGLLEFLLQHKANPNLPGKGVDAEQPLVLAAAKGDFRSVNLLLEYKADPNLYNVRSAINKAVMLDHFPMVRALIRNGANPNLGIAGKVCAGKLALDIAYRRASERIINLLLDNRALTEFECNRVLLNKTKKRRNTKPQSRNR